AVVEAGPEWDRDHPRLQKHLWDRSSEGLWFRRKLVRLSRLHLRCNRTIRLHQSNEKVLSTPEFGNCLLSAPAAVDATREASIPLRHNARFQKIPAGPEPKTVY